MHNKSIYNIFNCFFFFSGSFPDPFIKSFDFHSMSSLVDKSFPPSLHLLHGGLKLLRVKKLLEKFGYMTGTNRF
jgi:hypothetical protein